jgi:cytoskeleton protein RodZ
VSFGANLKRERELRGITLDEISRATKISVRLLEAIESDRFEILPQGVFRKSFIRAYAKYLGMSEEQVLQEYTLEVQSNSSLPAAEEKSKLSAPAKVTSWPRTLAIALLTSLLTLVLAYWYFSREQNSATSQPESTSTKKGAVPSVMPAPSGSSANLPTTVGKSDQKPGLNVLGELAKKPEMQPPAASGTETGRPSGAATQGAAELRVEATDDCWLSVNTEDGTLFSGFIEAQEARQFSLHKPLKIIVGNAGGVKMLVNGQPFASLGKSGERKMLEVSAENYQQYLVSKIP